MRFYFRMGTRKEPMSEKCGCGLITINCDTKIIFCPLHLAAPELMEATAAFLAKLGDKSDITKELDNMKAALSHAKKEPTQ